MSLAHGPNPYINTLNPSRPSPQKKYRPPPPTIGNIGNKAAAGGRNFDEAGHDVAGGEKTGTDVHLIRTTTIRTPNSLISRVRMTEPPLTTTTPSGTNIPHPILAFSSIHQPTITKSLASFSIVEEKKHFFTHDSDSEKDSKKQHDASPPLPLLHDLSTTQSMEALDPNAFVLQPSTSHPTLNYQSFHNRILQYVQDHPSYTQIDTLLSDFLHVELYHILQTLSDLSQEIKQKEEKNLVLYQINLEQERELRLNKKKCESLEVENRNMQGQVERRSTELISKSEEYNQNLLLIREVVMNHGIHPDMLVNYLGGDIESADAKRQKERFAREELLENYKKIQMLLDHRTTFLLENMKKDVASKLQLLELTLQKCNAKIRAIDVAVSKNAYRYKKQTYVWNLLTCGELTLERLKQIQDMYCGEEKIVEEKAVRKASEEEAWTELKVTKPNGYMCLEKLKSRHTSQWARMLRQAQDGDLEVLDAAGIEEQMDIIAADSMTAGKNNGTPQVSAREGKKRKSKRGTHKSSSSIAEGDLSDTSQQSVKSPTSRPTRSALRRGSSAAGALTSSSSNINNARATMNRRGSVKVPVAEGLKSSIQRLVEQAEKDEKEERERRGEGEGEEGGDTADESLEPDAEVAAATAADGEIPRSSSRQKLHRQHSATKRNNKKHPSISSNSNDGTASPSRSVVSDAAQEDDSKLRSPRPAASLRAPSLLKQPSNNSSAAVSRSLSRSTSLAGSKVVSRRNSLERDRSAERAESRERDREERSRRGETPRSAKREDATPRAQTPQDISRSPTRSPTSLLDIERELALQSASQLVLERQSSELVARIAALDAQRREENSSGSSSVWRTQDTSLNSTRMSTRRSSLMTSGDRDVPYTPSAHTAGTSDKSYSQYASSTPRSPYTPVSSLRSPTTATSPLPTSPQIDNDEDMTDEEKRAKAERERDARAQRIRVSTQLERQRKELEAQRKAMGREGAKMTAKLALLEEKKQELQRSQNKKEDITAEVAPQQKERKVVQRSVGLQVGVPFTYQSIAPATPAASTLSTTDPSASFSLPASSQPQQEWDHYAKLYPHQYDNIRSYLEGGLDPISAVSIERVRLGEREGIKKEPRQRSLSPPTIFALASLHLTPSERDLLHKSEAKKRREAEKTMEVFTRIASRGAASAESARHMRTLLQEEQRRQLERVLRDLELVKESSTLGEKGWDNVESAYLQAQLQTQTQAQSQPQSSHRRPRTPDWSQVPSRTNTGQPHQNSNYATARPSSAALSSKRRQEQELSGWSDHIKTDPFVSGFEAPHASSRPPTASRSRPATQRPTATSAATSTYPHVQHRTALASMPAQTQPPVDPNVRREHVLHAVMGDRRMQLQQGEAVRK